MAILNLSHVGLCVSDLEVSLRFYRDVLGFKETGRFQTAGEPSERLVDLTPLDVTAVYLERDGTCIELLAYAKPGVTGGRGPRPMNQLGLTHLSLRVDDLDATVSELVAQGVRVRASTRISTPEVGMAAVMLTDPDGLNIELYQAPVDITRIQAP